MWTASRASMRLTPHHDLRKSDSSKKFSRWERSLCILVCASPTHSSRPARSFLATAAALLLGGCAHQASTLTSSADWQQTLAQWTDAQVIALGEQHDQIAHHQWEAQTVQWLAAGQRLGALVIEMAPAGAARPAWPPPLQRSRCSRHCNGKAAPLAAAGPGRTTAPW